MGIAIGWKDPTPEQLLMEAREDAERMANERPPEGWPADKPTVGWKVVGLLTTDDLSGTQAERAAMWSNSGESDRPLGKVTMPGPPINSERSSSQHGQRPLGWRVFLLIAAAIAAALITAVLILRLESPDRRNFSEVRYGRLTAQNRERRNEYLAAGGIVVVTLIGAAWLVRRPRP
jgi:hypothetical protein